MKFIMALLLVGAVAARAQLAVTVSLAKITSQKAVITLALTNNLAEAVESARAICFLLDDQGKMVGQSTKWVIGGTKDRPALQPKSGTSFNFVITGSQPFISTNLTARVAFSRVVLSGQKVADPKRDVVVQNAGLEMP